MSDTVEMRYNMDEPILREAMAGAGKFVQTRTKSGSFLTYVLGGAIFGACLVIGLRLGLGFDLQTSHFIAALLGAALFATVFLGIIKGQQKALAALAMESEEKRGETVAVLGPNGVHFSSALGENWFVWDAVLEVLAMERSTGVVVDGLVYPLPHAGLPDGMAPQELQLRISKWRSL